MPWCCHLPSGKTVVLDDLCIEVFGDIASTEGLAPGEWYGLLNAPALHARAAVRLLAACAEHAGDPPPPDGYLTGGNILDVFERVEDDRPVEDIDGIPVVDPKAEADVPVTMLSSGP